MRAKKLGFVSLLGVSLAGCDHEAPSVRAVPTIAAASSSEKAASTSTSTAPTSPRVEGPCARHDDLPPFRLERPHVASTSDAQVVVVSDTTGDVAKFDPACRTWTALPKLASRRTSGAAITELTSGDLLVAGGSAAGQPWSERLPRGAASWQTLATSGKVAADKTGQLFAISDDRAVWVGASIALYDGKTHVWQALGSVEEPLGRSAIRLPTDEIVVLGSLRPTLVVDGKKGSIRQAPPFDSASGVAVRDGRVLLFANGRATWFDPKLSSFREVARKDASYTKNARAASLPDGKVLILGDERYDEEIFDPTSETSERRPAPHFVAPDLTSLRDGRVLSSEGFLVRGADGRYRTGFALAHPSSLVRLPSGKILVEDPRGIAEVSKSGELTFASSRAWQGTYVALDEQELLVGDDRHGLARYAWKTGDVKPWPLPAGVVGATPMVRAGEKLVFALLHDHQPLPRYAWIDGSSSKLVVGERLTAVPQRAVALGEGRVLVLAVPQHAKDQVWFIARPSTATLAQSSLTFPKSPVQAMCALTTGSALLVTGNETSRGDHVWLYRMDGPSETLTDLGAFPTREAPRCTARGDGRALLLGDTGPILAIDPSTKRIDEVPVAGPYVARSRQFFTEENQLAFVDGNLLSVREGTNQDPSKRDLLLVAPIP